MLLQVVETRPMTDGALRAAIALGEESKLHGWISLLMKDGTENAAYLEPQPEEQLWSEALRAMVLAPVPTTTSAGGAMFVF